MTVTSGFIVGVFVAGFMVGGAFIAVAVIWGLGARGD